MATFTKLPNQTWGVRLDALETQTLGAGVTVSVTKANGTTKAVVLARQERLASDGSYSVWSVAAAAADLRPVYYAGRPRGYSRRAGGEQASFASQSAPYDLAPPRDVTYAASSAEADPVVYRAYDGTELRASAVLNPALYGQPQPSVADASAAASTQAALADYASVFQTLLARPSAIDGAESTLVRL